MNKEIIEALKRIQAEQEKIAEEIEKLNRGEMEEILSDLDKIINSQIELYDDLQKIQLTEKKDK